MSDPEVTARLIGFGEESPAVRVRNNFLLEAIYENFIPYGSDGVFGRDSESVDLICELARLPEHEPDDDRGFNELFVEGGFEESGPELVWRGLDVIERRAYGPDPDTGEEVSRLLDFEVDIVGTARLLKDRAWFPEDERPESYPDDYEYPSQ